MVDKVDPAATTTTVTSSTNPSVFGQSVTFTATVSVVSPGAGTPSGRVDFFDTTTGKDLGKKWLIGNTATLSTAGLSVGNQVITATYSGDGNFNGSSNSLTQTVNMFASIASKFNGTTIAAGNYIWFTSVVTVSGLSAKAPTTIWFIDQTITGGSNFSVQVPNASITYHPGRGTAATTFTLWGGWHTDVYVGAGLSGNQFLSGLAYYVPAKLPGSIQNVTWSGLLFADQSGVSINWKWAAAVYTAMPYTTSPMNVNYNALAVKPVDDNTTSIYKNSDNAGTPEGMLANGASIKSKVTAGATGSGGSNDTGGYSASLGVIPLSELDELFILLGNGC